MMKSGVTAWVIMGAVAFIIGSTCVGVFAEEKKEKVKGKDKLAEAVIRVVKEVKVIDPAVFCKEAGIAKRYIVQTKEYVMEDADARVVGDQMKLKPGQKGLKVELRVYDCVKDEMYVESWVNPDGEVGKVDRDNDPSPRRISVYREKNYYYKTVEGVWTKAIGFEEPREEMTPLSRYGAVAHVFNSWLMADVQMERVTRLKTIAEEELKEHGGMARRGTITDARAAQHRELLAGMAERPIRLPHVGLVPGLSAPAAGKESVLLLSQDGKLVELAQTFQDGKLIGQCRNELADEFAMVELPEVFDRTIDFGMARQGEEGQKRFDDQMVLNWINTPNEEKQKRLGVVLAKDGKTSLKVIKVLPGSIAEGMRLKEGDEIIEIDGVLVGTLPMGRAVEMLKRPGAKLKLMTGQELWRP